MSAGQGTAYGARPPLTPGQLLIKIRNFHREHHRWPTAAELVTSERSLAQIRDKVRMLRNQGLLDREGLQLVITDTGSGVEAPVTRTVWTKEQVEAHLRGLRIDPTPGSTKTLPVQPTQPEQETAKEETETMGRPRKLPPHEELLKEAEEIRASGANAPSVLAFRYGTTAKTADEAIRRARLALGLPSRRTRPATMTTEAPERAQETTEPLEQGEGSAEQETEQAQEPEIIGGVATEGETQAEGAQTQEASQQAEAVDGAAERAEAQDDAAKKRAEAERVEATDPFGWRPIDLEKSALDIASELIRRRNLRLIPVLIDEIEDDKTLGRVLHRLRREGAA